MPRIGCLGRIIIGVVVLLASFLISGLFLPVPNPAEHMKLPAGRIVHLATVPVLGDVWITNTMIAAWLTVIVLLVLFYLGTRKMKLIPKGLQNIVETILETLLNLVEQVAGKKHARRFFPVVATIFLFVIMNAYLALLPGFNFIGFGHQSSYTGFMGQIAGRESSGFLVNTPLLRSANTDINIPLTLALISFLFVEYWGITSLGFRHYAGKFFRVGQLLRGRVIGVVDLFIGVLELFTELIRIISFTFRLFGNMTAGEVVLLMFAFIIPWLVPSIFYGLETILGLVQALIFGTLTLVFATMAVTPHGGEHE